MFVKDTRKEWVEPTGKKYDVEEVKEPNLYRDIFPYSEPPKVPFDGIAVPTDPPDEIWITDTSFRDGQQARPPYTVEETAFLYDMFHKLGGPEGIIRKSEFFVYSKKDRDAVEKCQEFGYEYPKVTAWIRAVKGDLQIVKDMGIAETGILTSISDYHIFNKLKMDRKSAINAYLEVVDEALENDIEVRCHFEDITRADFYGSVVPFAQILMERSEESGIPITIRICDTMGYGVPYPGASLPRSVPKLVSGLHKEAGVPPEQLEWHGHNDFHKVLINASTAWLYGCCAANGTILGFGERTGNPPIEGLIIEYIGLTGEMNGIDLKAIHEITDFFLLDLKEFIPRNYPFVGADFNTTRAGIHADGLIKNEEIYNIFDTAELLNRPPGIAITDKSGLAGIAYWINSFIGDEMEEEVGKKDERIQKIAQWVDKQYEKGRTTAISGEEMLEQVEKYFPKYKKLVERLRRTRFFVPDRD